MRVWRFLFFFFFFGGGGGRGGEVEGACRSSVSNFKRTCRFTTYESGKRRLYAFQRTFFASIALPVVAAPSCVKCSWASSEQETLSAPFSVNLLREICYSSVRLLVEQDISALPCMTSR